ncbi:Protein CLEC16A [Auxenochlorella protothecoides]|uniref:Protein CLEC16A n=1 Tax=Auxenochlorella protothecoides TaxID=3075 RepID=A0A087SC18_AUXPR|nr:Protein CLEC16A [Auxenochlorella protothecoides]KFM23272.1 Protein CLEC16A [Auxenochlorella protothecoides]
MAGEHRGFWSSLFSPPPRDRFSLEELSHLHSVLLRNAVVNDGNRDTVVETLRSISELVIWGDQNDPSMVDYFLTNNVLAHFAQILQQRANRRGGVAQQVLQTLSILLQNVRTQQTVYYLFSNNHINDIVGMAFDFEDDEVLGYYINLLKTISLRLNEATVQFFFQAGGPGTPASLPLYSEAVKFINHRDGMVRAAVKTLTLNVYAIPLPALHAYLTAPPAAGYLDSLATYLAEHALLLDRLWSVLVGPVLFWPLIQDDVAVAHIATLAHQADQDQQGQGTGGVGGAHARPAPPAPLQRGVVGPLASLYVLERLLFAVLDTPFLSALQQPLPAHLRALLQYEPAAYRGALLGMLHGGEPQLAAAAARLLAALLRSRTLDEGLLEGIGLLPRRRKRQLELLTALTRDSSTTGLDRVASSSGGPPARQQSGSAPASRQASLESAQSAAAGSGAGHAQRMARPSASPLPLPPLTDSAKGDAAQAEVVEALLSQLGHASTPPLALATLSWLLPQLLSDSDSGAALTPHQQDLLDAALRTARVALHAAAHGPWGDALAELVAAEWPRARAACLRTGSGSLHTAAAGGGARGGVREGVVLRSPAEDAAQPSFPCTVAFSRGRERHVSLRIEPWSPLLAGEGARDGHPAPTTGGPTEPSQNLTSSPPPVDPPTTVVLAELVDGSWAAAAAALDLVRRSARGLGDVQAGRMRPLLLQAERVP